MLPLLGSENNYLIEWEVLRRPIQAPFPQGKSSIRSWEWCLASGGRKERQGAEGSLTRNSRKLIWGRSSRASFSRRQPKHVSPNIARVQTNPSSLVERQNSSAFFFIFMQPFRAETDEPEDCRQYCKRRILRKPRLQVQPIHSGPVVCPSIQRNSSFLSDLYYLFLTLHQLPQAWEEAEKEKSN